VLPASCSGQTRWVVLTGNYMRLFPSQDYPHAKKTLYLANCEIKENPAKAQIKFKIHGKRRSYELRPREKRDYELWLTALQGAQKFKDPRDEQRPPSLNRAPSEESLDELDVVDDLSGVPGLETEPVPPNLTPAQYEHEEQQRRQQLGAALRDMRQALSRLDKRSSHDTQAYGSGRRSVSTIGTLALNTGARVRIALDPSARLQGGGGDQRRAEALQRLRGRAGE